MMKASDIKYKALENTKMLLAIVATTIVIISAMFAIDARYAMASDLKTMIESHSVDINMIQRQTIDDIAMVVKQHKVDIVQLSTTLNVQTLHLRNKQLNDEIFKMELQMNDGETPFYFVALISRYRAEIESNQREVDRLSLDD